MIIYECRAKLYNNLTRITPFFVKYMRKSHDVYVDVNSNIIKDFSKKKIVVLSSLKSPNIKDIKSKNTTVIVLKSSLFNTLKGVDTYYFEFIKSNMASAVIIPNLLDTYIKDYKLPYSRDWKINSDGNILILLSNMHGWYAKKGIMKVSTLQPMITKIREQTSNKIIIRLHRKNMEKSFYNKYIRQDAEQLLQNNNNIEIDQTTTDHKPNTLMCVISDMTHYGLYYAFLGVPIFSFASEQLKLNEQLPSDTLDCTNYDTLSKQNLILENLNPRYFFFNEYCNKTMFIDSSPKTQKHILNFFCRL
jgi:hypothetical protein